MKPNNRIIRLITAFLLLLPSAVLAENKLSIQPFSIKAGETKELTICLNNDKEMTAVLFDMILPQGLTIPVDADDEYQIAIAGRTTTNKHSLNANAVGGGYRFLLTSMRNAVFSGNEGALITVTLVASSDFAGGTITLQDIELVSPDETAVNPDPISVVVSSEPTTVKNIQHHKAGYKETYDLRGRKASGDARKRGLYIVDGCKVMR